METNLIEPIELIEPLNISMDISGVNSKTKFCNEGYICAVGEIVID